MTNTDMTSVLMESIQTLNNLLQELKDLLEKQLAKE